MKSHEQNDEHVTGAQVAAYLQENPQFFEHNPALLAEIYLPSPHGNGTISLAERQQLAQRDKVRVLETKCAELLRFGTENDAISDKVHRLSLGLLATQSFEVLMQLLVHSLREDFLVPHAAIRLWAAPQNQLDNSNIVFQPVAAELKEKAQSLATPYCGHHPDLELEGWFGENVAPKSFALIALRSEKVFGLLVMASEDAERFYPEMGTLYVRRIGELVSAALLRYIV